MNVCFFNIRLVSTCKIQHCQLFVFAWDMSFPQRCLILSFLLVWKDQDRIWQEVTLCFSSHSIKQMAHFYSNRKSNITAWVTSLKLCIFLSCKFLQFAFFPHWLQFSDNKDFHNLSPVKSYQPCINIPAVLNSCSRLYWHSWFTYWPASLDLLSG